MRCRLAAMCVAILAARPAWTRDFPAIGSQDIDFGASMASVRQMPAEARLVGWAYKDIFISNLRIPV